MDRKYRKLENLESLMPKVARHMGIESRMKEVIIMNYWPEIAKGEIGKDSRPYNISRSKQGLVLHVAAKSSMVAQELNMIKMVLIDKVNVLASQIGLSISDIIVSTKYWSEVGNNEPGKQLENNNKQQPGSIIDQDLDSIVLTEEQKDSVESTLETLDLEEKLKDSLRQVMYKDLKLKNYKKQMGYPVCKNCGVPFNRTNEDFCPACRFQ